MGIDGRLATRTKTTASVGKNGPSRFGPGTRTTQTAAAAGGGGGRGVNQIGRVG